MKKTLASTLLLVLLPFLLFSETSAKRIIETWLQGCVVVLEKRATSKRRVEVRAYMNGVLPAKLPFSFNAPEVLIHQVEFRSTPDDLGNDPYSSLALHPLDRQTCPGHLCEGWMPVPGGGDPVVNFDLTDISESFAYRFLVDLERDGAERDVGVFVVFETGLKDGTCKVENANLFNIFVRISKFWRFIWTVILFALVSYAILVLTRWKEGAR
jgi:hypothetical protein